jgi:two-component system, cell cycle response regulator DivK
MATVLLVDDQLELRSIHAVYLQLHGHHVVTADDARAGLEAARTCEPDLIVLDQSMPGKTGVEMTRELRADARFAKVPIIMLTAHAYGAVGMKARDAGCDSFVSKPCAPSRLLQEVLRFTPVPAST